MNLGPNFCRKVLITGYTTNCKSKTNPSWEGVNFMDLTRIEAENNIILVRKEIDVKYEQVDEQVPRWWKNHQPHLTIHVGLAPDVSCFVLETQANKEGYNLPDEADCHPFDGKNVRGGPKTLVTQLDVGAICRQFNCNPGNIEAKISSNAGRYLCEYIYYTSLCVGRSPTLFVHVPENKYTKEQLAEGLERILKLCLAQLP